MFGLIDRRVISVKTGLFFQEIIFITEFPGSNFLLPTFLTGAKWDFPVADLRLATVNFKPCPLQFEELICLSTFISYLSLVMPTGVVGWCDGAG